MKVDCRLRRPSALWSIPVLRRPTQSPARNAICKSSHVTSRDALRGTSNLHRHHQMHIFSDFDAAFI